MATTAATPLSAAARARLRRPRARGHLAPVDAARRRMALLSVADSAGQARIYWLVDPASHVIEDARFLAFGDLASHAIADAFSEQVRGRTVEDAARLTAEQIELLLRDDAGTPAFGDAALAPLAFLAELQDKAVAALPSLEVLPPPADEPVYQRKRRQDWSEEDRRWFETSYLKRVGQVEAIIAEVLRSHLREEHGVRWRLEAINDDFRVVLRFEGLPAEQVPTLCQMVQDALRGRLHGQLVVEPSQD